MRWLKRLSPRATWLAVFVAVATVLNVANDLAAWVFSWHQPWWLAFAAGVAFGTFASAAADHWRQIAEDRASAGEPS